MRRFHRETLRDVPFCSCVWVPCSRMHLSRHSCHLRWPRLPLLRDLEYTLERNGIQPGKRDGV
jgi:hypothetical protein